MRRQAVDETSIGLQTAALNGQVLDCRRRVMSCGEGRWSRQKIRTESRETDVASEWERVLSKYNPIVGALSSDI